MKAVKIFFGILAGLFALLFFAFLISLIARGSELSLIFGSLFWLLIGSVISVVLFVSAFKKKPLKVQSLNLSPEDINRMQVEVEYKNMKRDSWIWGCRSILKNKTILLLYGGFAVFMVISPFKKHEFGVTTVLAGILLAGVFLLLVYTVHVVLFTIILLFTHSAKKNKGVLTGHKIIFNKNGYIEETDVNRNEAKWKGVFKIEKGRWHIYLYNSPVRAHLIPKRAFKSDIEYDTFYNTLQLLKESAMAGDGTSGCAG